MLQLTNGVFRIRTYAVSQHHETQQVQVHHMGLNLLLSHVQQVQAVGVLDGTHRHRHHPEAVAAEIIPHLCKQVGCQRWGVLEKGPGPGPGGWGWGRGVWGGGSVKRGGDRGTRGG